MLDNIKCLRLNLMQSSILIVIFIRIRSDFPIYNWIQTPSFCVRFQSWISVRGSANHIYFTVRKLLPYCTQVRRLFSKKGFLKFNFSSFYRVTKYARLAQKSSPLIFFLAEHKVVFLFPHESFSSSKQLLCQAYISSELEWNRCVWVKRNFISHKTTFLFVWTC